METALRAAMKHVLDDFVVGLDKADTSQFPVVLRDLQLRPKRVNEELEDTPFTLSNGRVGMVKINPGWSGDVDVEASGIKLNLGFSAMKAARLAMTPGAPEYNTDQIFMTGNYAPVMPDPASVPPRYCTLHNTSDKRKKTAARNCECKSCGITFMSTYAEVVLCSSCSDQEKRCIICGAGADKEGLYIPSSTPANRPVGKENPPLPKTPRTASNRMAPANGSRQPGNLKPTNSFPVVTPVVPQAAKAAAPPPQRAATQQQAAARRMPPSSNQTRPRPQVEEDDNPFMALLRGFDCGTGDGVDEEEYTEPRRPVNGRPLPGRTR